MLSIIGVQILRKIFHKAFDSVLKLLPIAVNISMETLNTQRDGLLPQIFALIYNAKWRKFEEGGVGPCRVCGKNGKLDFGVLCKCALDDSAVDEWFLKGI
jgi:hypothetical protein